MISGLGTFQSLINKTGLTIIKPTVILTNATGTNITYNLNYTNNIGGTNYSYTKTDYKVYFVNNTAISSAGTTGTVSGTFTLTVSGASATIYYAISASGGGGGGGNEGGGGGSSGELKYGTITLPIGTYNCSFSLGNGGYGVANYQGSGPYLTNPTTTNSNGYGYVGANSVLIINGNTITANRGCPGGCAHTNNGATGFVLGGGSGTTFSNSGAITGASGTKFNGGSTINAGTNQCAGGASGASNQMAGRNSTVSSNPSAGMLGGDPTPSTLLPLGLQFNQTCYFCEGGHGTNARYTTTATIINATQSVYKLAGANTGVNGSVNQNATDSILGSGGSGMIYDKGTSRNSGGNGGNGFFFISFLQ